MGVHGAALPEQPLQRTSHPITCCLPNHIWGCWEPPIVHVTPEHMCFGSNVVSMGMPTTAWAGLHVHSGSGSMCMLVLMSCLSH